MHFKPKKSLGQNFLIDKNIQKKIIFACAFTQKDIVLEIGAGRGELTVEIAKIAKKVYALEIDSFLYNQLKEKLKTYSNLKLIHQDILKFDLNQYLRKIRKKIKVIGNIPYYITTPIIEHLLKFRNKIDCIFLTLQKEFARRIIASPGSKVYGSLTCLVQYYTQPELLFYIKRNSFMPVPKVDSCFLKLKILRTPPVETKNEDLFFTLIRLAFNQRRKTLRNSLRGIVEPKKLEAFFAKFKINPNIRPEDLSLDDFANLANLSD